MKLSELKDVITNNRDAAMRSKERKQKESNQSWFDLGYDCGFIYACDELLWAIEEIQNEHNRND